MISKNLAEEVAAGNPRALARLLSLIEQQSNQVAFVLSELSLSEKNQQVVGFTGPPGAGKSSLIGALIKFLRTQNLTIGVIAVDPSSPFHKGALLGDRIRMNDHYLDPGVFIRSLATRGALGGLTPSVFEMIDAYKGFGFDIIIIETVGVGQSEVEIARIADTTVVVLVPEAGDEIQTLKSGIMEVADVFALNKSDREGASIFLKNLKSMVHEKSNNIWETPVISTQATDGTGIEQLWEAIKSHSKQVGKFKKEQNLKEKAWQFLTRERLQPISEASFYATLEQESVVEGFNLYAFVAEYSKKHPLI